MIGVFLFRERLAPGSVVGIVTIVAGMPNYCLRPLQSSERKQLGYSTRFDIRRMFFQLRTSAAAGKLRQNPTHR